MSNPKYIVQRDTTAWSIQVWISFILSLVACSGGVWLLPAQELEKAFLATGLFLCSFASFTVAKTIRDNRRVRTDTGGWIFIAWTGFIGAIGITAWGLWRLGIEDWQKAYLVVSWLFLISNSFTLAKTVRDKHEADQMIHSYATPENQDNLR